MRVNWKIMTGLVLAPAFAVFGCGGGGMETEPETADEPMETEAEAPAPAGPPRVFFVAPRDGDQRQFGRGEQRRRLLHHPHQIGRMRVAEDLPGAGRLAQIARDDARVRLAHLRHRLAGVEMDDLVDFEAPIGLAPPERGEMNHVALRS